MSCSIPKETTGFISISAKDWDEFKKEVELYLTDYYMMDDECSIKDLFECQILVPKFISQNDHDDLINYCDKAIINKDA